MNTTAMFISALIVLPAAGLLTWAWFAVAQIEEELRSFTGFDDLHFEIGPQAAHNAEVAKWPTPG
jgi:hypothetical protein